MADMEEIVDETETQETETQETTENYSELTEADYYALQERLKKAEESLVKYKKQVKQTPKEIDGEVLTKQDLELVRFIDKNPEYEGKEDEIKSFLKKGLTLSQIAKLVEPDETKTNREKTKQTSITAGEGGGGQTTYTKQELANLSQDEYNRVMDLKDAGKVVIKG